MTKDIFRHGHDLRESYFSQIFFTVTDLEKSDGGWNICGERKNISYVTKNIFCHGHDLRESCYT